MVQQIKCVDITTISTYHLSNIDMSDIEFHTYIVRVA